jgi:hypothetical protein
MHNRKWLLSMYLPVLSCFLAACTLSPLGAAAPRLAPVNAPATTDAEALAAAAKGKLWQEMSYFSCAGVLWWPCEVNQFHKG